MSDQINTSYQDINMSGDLMAGGAGYDDTDMSDLGCIDESLLSAMGNMSNMVNITLCSPGEQGGSYKSREFDALRDPRVAAAVIAVYVVIIVLGAVGNAMVVTTVVRTPALWNATNIFIANLAVADILVCVFDLPVSLYYQLTDNWIFGSFLCHIIPCTLGVVVYASALTLMLIAVDRYLLICCPTRQRISVKMAVLLCVVVSVIALAVTSPLGIYSKYVTMDDNDLGIHIRVCTESWPPRYRRLYSIVNLLFQHVFPLFVIAILYILIFKRLQQRIAGSSNRRTKTTKMLVAVVTIFGLAWTPFHVYALMGEFYYNLIKGRYYKLMDHVFRCFAMSSSCINPIFYGWFNDNYKNAFISMVKPKSRTKGKHVAIPQTARAVQSPQTPARNNKISRTNGKTLSAKVEDIPMTTVSDCVTPEISHSKPEATPLIKET